jgi:hypothetical protein
MSTKKERKRTMSDVRAANKAAGQFWFSRETMRFFKSKVETSLLRGGYFITSEREEAGSQRRYTIRRENAEHYIDTVGYLGEFRTLAAAQAALSDIRKGEA